MAGRSVRARTSAGLAVGLGAVLAAAVLAGCSGAQESGGSAGAAGSGQVADAGGTFSAPTPAGKDLAPDAAGAAAPTSTGAADSAPARTASGGTADVLLNRSVVRTASLTVRVPDVLATSARVSALAASDGGFVAGEQTQADPDHPAKAEAVLTLRVPSSRMPQLLTQLHGLGTLLSEQQSADDVTGQVIDVQARIAAQRASVARITALMSRANTLGQVVQIEGELTSRQAALESLRGQAAALADQTSLATVTATLVGPSRPVVVPHPKPVDAGFGAGLAKGWHGFTAAGTWVLTAIGTVLPFLLVVLPLAALLLLLARRRTPPPAAPASPEPPPAVA